MDVSTNLTCSTLAAAPQGACVIATFLNGQTGVGIVTTFDRQNALALLKPKTLDEPPFGAMGVIYGDHYTSLPVLQIEGAKARIPDEPNKIHRGFNPPVGALIVGEDSFYVMVHLQDVQVRLVNIVSGELRNVRINDPVYWFSAWSIVAPDLNGSLTTVCEVTQS